MYYLWRLCCLFCFAECIITLASALEEYWPVCVGVFSSCPHDIEFEVKV